MSLDEESPTSGINEPNISVHTELSPLSDGSIYFLLNSVF